MTDTQLREADVLKVLQDVVDPEIGRTLGQLEMLKTVRVDANGAIHAEIELPTPAYPHRERDHAGHRESIERCATAGAGAA